MTRKATWLFAAIVVGAVLAPQAVLAAVGSFSSSSTTPAVTGTNTYSGTGQAPGGRFICAAKGCRAVYATSNGTSNGSYGIYAEAKDPTGRALAGFNTATTGTAIGLSGQSNSATGRGLNGLALKNTGVNFGGFLETKSSTPGAAGAFGWASSTAGTGANYGVYGRNDGGGSNASGVYGNATKTTGNPQTNGVFGNAPSVNGAGVFGSGGAYGFYGAGGYAGGYGFGETLGIAGETNAIGDGSYGLLSYTDAGVAGHLLTTTGHIAGECDVVAASSANCTFATPFATGVVPIVVITASGGSPGADRYWITNQSNTGFTINTSGGTTATFGWIAIGIDDNMDTLAAARAGRSRAAGYR